MSKDFIVRSIKKHLSSDANDVLALMGGWGVGKTHLWNTIIKNEDKNINTAFNKYSYISVFGFNSLDKIQQSIIKNSITISSLNNGDKPTAWSMAKNLSSVLDSKVTGNIAKASGLNDALDRHRQLNFFD